ncbi:hypothetical protein SCOR_07105 [Sulfidibacter corallicola]|uniref:Gingipain domain-containing protein n=1 Tax=Sulfidibacter corallicola TaxID=2818388 RepID=A0A8A4TNC2_SULCO|nr:hypothetical protein [Sulfidibacter corallicola]QTD51466.1 hypothetical protein J3U87_03265 [Sulfidibacter corallicola]
MRKREWTVPCLALEAETGAYHSMVDTASLFAKLKSTTTQPVIRNLMTRTRLPRESAVCERGLMSGLDPESLEDAGWGLLFAEDDPRTDEILEALEPLWAKRAAEMGRPPIVFRGERGFRRTYRTASDFLEYHGVGHQAVDPSAGVPFYLLLIGGPESIPFPFHFDLQSQFAVGRLAFDSVDAYAHYADTVCTWDGVRSPHGLTTALFGPGHPGDRATWLSLRHLLEPLHDWLRHHREARRRRWHIRATLAEAALKKRLVDLLGGPDTPDLLFTVTHGVVYRPGHASQRARQGSLVCADWPGREAWSRGLVPHQFFGAEDLLPGADFAGLIAFLVTCYGAGCPAWDHFAFDDPESTGARALAPKPFMARLPTALLGNGRSGALAVVAHVERTWESSYYAPNIARNATDYFSVVWDLLNGKTVSSALSTVHARQAVLAARLNRHLLEPDDRPELAQRICAYWKAQDDARNTIVLGDPAVRLCRPERARPTSHNG